MATRKKKKKSIKVRVLFILLLFGVVIFALGSKFMSSIVNIKEMNDKKIALNKKDEALKEKKKELQADIEKLENPDYIAKYAREKYLYSKDGEMIIRITE